ncbi:MotA/TolQ/ExbB proton channel family protein [Leptolyngbya sp. FACHB-321]|uniref:MotA/TolQ/ExbB proton channel family protein n=1 Tax=Leptolyngbya sp. FACHB-321 TaxID=2692807 RepID=UPI0016853827|nr:MotA/TolQ/ExbB proton channel family protein [Leptolyngbya sp. FACHB-321]MBD2035204.1 MotA/TolQ/ExbB proton channel family protein [Leptolyngbya sp. FACHB-321]
MYPLLGLSVATLACGLDRALFWYRLSRREKRVAQDILEAAQYDLNQAAAIAERSNDQPIARFLLAPLKLRYPTPETFRLALEAAGDKEFVKMHKGNKLLESTVGLAPLLGLLGTVTGLIKTFANLNVGGGGSTAGATKAAAGIGEALIATAAGMLIAILALAIFRVLVSLQAQQVEYFSEVGSDLELTYRQLWHESTQNSNSQPRHSPDSLPEGNVPAERY